MLRGGGDTQQSDTQLFGGDVGQMVIIGIQVGCG